MLEKLKTRRLSDEEARYMVSSGHSKRETELFGHLIATFDLSQLEEAEQAMLKYFLALPPFDIPWTPLDSSPPGFAGNSQRIPQRLQRNPSKPGPQGLAGFKRYQAKTAGCTASWGRCSAIPSPRRKKTSKA
jgi:hypothetical protein